MSQAQKIRPGNGAVSGYAEEPRPLGSYAISTGVFAAAVGVSVLVSKARGARLPENVPLRDVLLMGVATHKLTRLISKEKVTSFIRAPFVRYEEPAGHGEVSEEPRGSGLQYTLGELLVCPYCLGQWVAAGFGIGYVNAPAPTRLVAAVYAAEAVSDFLQLAYKAADELMG